MCVFWMASNIPTVHVYLSANECFLSVGKNLWLASRLIFRCTTHRHAIKKHLKNAKFSISFLAVICHNFLKPGGLIPSVNRDGTKIAVMTSVWETPGVQKTNAKAKEDTKRFTSISARGEVCQFLNSQCKWDEQKLRAKTTNKNYKSWRNWNCLLRNAWMKVKVKVKMELFLPCKQYNRSYSTDKFGSDDYKQNVRQLWLQL